MAMKSSDFLVQMYKYSYRYYDQHVLTCMTAQK